MHKEICVQMVKDTDNVISWIVLYRPPKPECISWKPYQRNVPYDERIAHRKRVLGYKTCLDPKPV